jgi:hypothetical protein
MPETAVLFFAAIVVIACAILITFYSLFRRTHPAHENRTENGFICPTGSEGIRSRLKL